MLSEEYFRRFFNFQETNPSSLMKRNLWKRKLELTNRTSSKLRISHNPQASSFSILGGSAHPKTRYVSWVQNDVNQFGSWIS